MVKNCLQCRRPRFYSWVRKITWKREWLPTPVFLPGEFHEQRSLCPSPVWPLSIYLDSPNVLGSHAVFFTALHFTFTTRHIRQLGIISALAQPLHTFWIFLCSSPVAYWTPTNVGSSSFSVMYFCLFILFMVSQGKNAKVACYSLLQWIMFCQNCLPWPIRLWWSYMAWLIISLN